MHSFDRSLLAAYVRPEWRRAAVLGLFLLAGIALQLANPQIAKTFIDGLQSGAGIRSLMWIAVVFLGVAILMQVASVAETYVAEDLGWRTTNALRSDLTRHVLDLEGSFHSDHTPGELIERIDGDVSAIADFFSQFVVQMLGSGLFLLGVLALLYLADWRVGLVLTACSIVAMLFMMTCGGFVARRARVSRQAAADLTGYIEERLAGLPDIKTSGADGYVMSRLHERLAARFRRTWASARAGSLFNGAVGVMFAVGSGGALMTAALLHRSSAISLGSVYVIFRYSGMLMLPLYRLSRQMNTMQQAVGGIARVRELLETGNPDRNVHPLQPANSLTLPAGPLAVEFDSVSFAYADLPVLQDISFRLEPGQKLGLLGRTGSGKTTISRLLFGLHKPSAGRICVGDVDLRSLSLDDLRARVGLVTQDVQLFHASIRDNVTLFDNSVSDEWLRQTFTHLGLDEWLRNRPDGLDTMLGSGGSGVSAGEGQLVALARVFLRDPGLVILDEASSRLDPSALMLSERALDRLLTGRTAIVIAHRLETVERADTILILDGGRCLEYGLREQLAADPDSRFSRLRHGAFTEMLA